MRRKLSIVALTLLLIFMPALVVADTNPALGDQGGALSAELEKQLKQKNRGSTGQTFYFAIKDFMEGNPALNEPEMYSELTEPYPYYWTGSVGGAILEPYVPNQDPQSSNTLYPYWSANTNNEASTSNEASVSYDYQADPRFYAPGTYESSNIPSDQQTSSFGTVGQSIESGTPFETQVDPRFYIPGTFGESTLDQSASTSTQTSSGGTQTLDWFNGGLDLLKANKNIQIYDTKAGTTWSAKYINGANHADIIPASKADADLIKSKKITGSYERRPVVVTIAGTKYAGSMYAVGHGSTSYCNYFKGVMCIHFTGSMTHGSKKVDTAHQNAISEALKSGN